MTRRIGENIVISAWNLSRESDRESYEMEVALIIARDLLNASQVGRIVVESIQAISGRRMTIQPWTDSSENAEAVPLDLRGGTARGEPIRDTNGRAMPNAGFGSGVGTSTVVRYSPRRHKLASFLFPGERRVRVQFDQREVLLHEMCHGLRQMLGVETMRAMPNNLENEEEFFAALVTNIYSSEKNRPLLADHGERELRRPEFWLTNATFRRRIQSFQNQMRPFSNRMASVNARFNPFRDIPANV